MTGPWPIGTDDRPAIVFDVFRTLVRFDGDHVDDDTFGFLADWLGYRGILVDDADLAARFDATTQRHLDAAPGQPPDVEVVGVWEDVLGSLPDPRERTGADRRDLATELALTYRQITTRTLEVWPGTEEMLAACQGVRLAIASNTQRVYTRAELERLGLWDPFEVVVFSSDVRACKPDPAVITTALERLAIPPHRAVYIGDNAYDDVTGAGRAGLPTVLLDRGTPVPDDVVLEEPLARVAGDDPVAAVEIARRHLDAGPRR